MARVRLVLAAMVALALTMLGAPELVNAEPAPGGEAAADSTAGPAPVSERRDLAKELGGTAAEVDASGGIDAKPGPALDRDRVSEEVQFRSEGSETWKLDDGSNVTEFFGAPKWFRDGKGEWAKVDPKLVASGDGSVSAAGVGFGWWVGASQDGVRLSFEGREVSFRLLGRDGVKPALDRKDPTVVWLRGVWDGVDVKYTVSGSGVKEEFVVSSPEALGQPGVFTSSLSSEGVLVGDQRRPGGLVLDWNGNGKTAVDGDGDGPKVSIDPPLVTTAKGDVVRDAAASYGVDEKAEFAAALQGEVGRRDRTVGVAVDSAVLAKLPADAFPVSVDPSFQVIPASMGGSWASYDSLNGVPGGTGTAQGGLLGNWRVFGSDDYWRFNIAPGYQYLWTNVAPNARVFGANLRLDTFPYPSASAPFASSWSSFPTSSNPAYPTACFASAWSYAGAYPGWNLGQCTDGYFYGYTWTGSAIGAHPSTGYVDVTNLVRPYVANHDTNLVLGVSVDNWPGGYDFKVTAPSLEIQWDTPSPAVSGMTPGDGATSTSPTPTLSWGAVTDPDSGQSPEMYRAILFAGPQSGLGDDPVEQCGGNRAIWSTGWQNATSTTVPGNILQDGVTYYWTVASAGTTYPPYATCAPVQKFKVDRRLGASGPAPVESFGPVSVNLATGNVIAGAGSQSIPTVGGDIGMQFVYNSQNKPQNGLRAQYFRGVSPRANVTGPLDFNMPFLARVDEAINFNWGVGGPRDVELDDFTARWTGYVTVPTAGSYCFGTNADDGSRVWVDNTLVMDNWVNQPATDKACSTPISFAAGETKSIRVEYYDHQSAASIQLKTYGPSPVTGIVPTSWLTTDIPVLGPGWTMSDGDVSVSGARNSGSGVTLTMGDGSTVEYKKSDSGAYVGPAGDGTVVTVDPISNGITVVDDSGTTYTYSKDGELLSAVAAVDDTHPAATINTWSGSTKKLTSMTDPVSGQSVTLRYGGGAGCATPPSGFAISPGLLCRVESWDGRATDLFYNQGRLERVVNPGGARTSFTYDSSNQLTSVTDATANDAVDAGVRTADASVSWQVAYTGVQATTVTAPAPTAGATRQTFTVNYDSAATTGTPGVSRVTASGLSAPNGYTKKVSFDTSYRTTSTWDDNGQRSDVTYDGVSDRVSFTDTNVGTAQAMRSSTVYDTSVVFNGLSRPVTSYGPAPVGYFTANSPLPNLTGPVPSSTTAYDEAINGLSAAWWDDTLAPAGTPVRAAFVGAPKVHKLLTGLSSWTWGTGSPDAAVPVDKFSGRLTGLIYMATSGAYSFGVFADDGMRLTIDDKVVADRWTSGTTYWESPAVSFTAGWHRISVEVREDSGNAELGLNWLTPGAGFRVNIPAASLKPDLGLVTSTTTDAVDGAGASTATSTSTSYPDPITGLAGATVVDPSGLKLTSGATYETKGATGSFLRKLTSTLPAGYDATGAAVAQPGGGTQAATTTYAYYGATDAGPSGTTCAGVASNQAGRMKSRTKADPDGTGAAAAVVDEFAYDTSGRTVATRTVGDAAWSCTVYDARGRPTSQTYPVFTNPADSSLNTAARTVTTAYSVSSSPLKTKVTDSSVSGDLVTTVDLRGRVTDYTDSSGYTTSTVYDVAGRVTSVTVKNPSAVTVETLSYTYNTTGSGVNELATVSLDGVQQAAVSYDAIGRASGYTYANGTTGTAGFDPLFQRQTGLSYALGATSVTADAVTRDAKTGMIVDQSVDGVDANTAGANFGYDKAGRLTSWWARDPSSGNKYQGTYSFTGYAGTAPGCGNVQWGRNSNRLSFSRSTYNSAGTLVGSTVDQSCYDNADRLTTYTPASGPSPYTAVTYDAHGNTITMGAEVHGYDSADRHLVSKAAVLNNAASAVQLKTANGKCFDVEGPSAADGAILQQWSCNSPAVSQQVWSLVAADGPWFDLVSQLSGKCMAPQAGATADGTKFVQGPCDQTNLNQQFRLVDAGSGSWQLVSRPSSKCVDVPSNSSADGQDLQLLTCSSGTAASKQHTIRNTAGTVVSPATVRATAASTVPTAGKTNLQLRARSNWKCADVRGPSSADGTVIQQWSCSVPAVSQQSVDLVVDGGSNQVKVKFRNANKCLQAQTDNTVVQSTCVASAANQRWTFTETPGGWRLTTSLNGSCLDSSPAGGDGVGLVLAACNSTPTAAELWVLTDPANGAIVDLDADLSAVPTVVYTRDAADRITKRTVNGTAAAKYAYTAAADSPALTLDNAGAVIEKTISLPGGVLVTKRGSVATDVWSYPNLHGDIVATCNGSGTKSGATKAYDPFGNPLGTTSVPDNSAANLDYGWHGQQQRPLEHETGLQPLIEMGARQYDPLLGRFLELDPVEGGVDNDYVYPVNPVGQTDLDGRCGLGNPFKKCGRRHKGGTNIFSGFHDKVLKPAARRVWTNGVRDHWRGAVQVVAAIGAAACIVGSSGTATALCAAGYLAVAADVGRSYHDNVWRRQQAGRRPCWGSFASDVGLSAFGFGAGFGLARITSGAARAAPEMGGFYRAVSGTQAGALSGTSSMASRSC